MITRYPLTFRVSTSATSGTGTPWTSTFYPSTGESLSASVAVPIEFQGPGGGYSPEDFYSSALINCFTATFKVIAEKSNLSFSQLLCEGTLTLDRDEKGTPQMSAFHLKGTLSGVLDSDRAKRILEKTSGACMILNSVNLKKNFEWIIEGTS